MRPEDYDDTRSAPPTVVAAAACGTAPVPFLAIYAVLFIVHGSVHPVVPPDITSSTRGELLAGIAAAVVFLLSVITLMWAMSGRRRWPFALVQAGLLGASVWFLIDGTEGGDLASALVLACALAALVLAFVPASWPHYRKAGPPPGALLARPSPRTEDAPSPP